MNEAGQRAGAGHACLTQSNWLHETRGGSFRLCDDSTVRTIDKQSPEKFRHMTYAKETFKVSYAFDAS